MRRSRLDSVLRPTLLAAAVATAAGGAVFAGSAGHGQGQHDGDDHGHGQDEGHGMAIGAPGTAAEVDRTVSIEAGDIYFKPDGLQVAAGETVRFVIHNTGALLHEFNLGTAAMHGEHQEEMQEMMERGMLTATGMKPMAGMEHGEGMPMRHDDPNSVLVEPGETRELIWTFSGTAALEFACNLPGHYPSGMHGGIEVQE